MIARARAPYTPMYTPEHACTHPSRVDVSSHVRSMRRGVAADIGRARLCVANTPPITHPVRRTSRIHGVARRCARRCTTVFRRRSPWTTVPRGDVQTPVEAVAFYYCDSGSTLIIPVMKSYLEGSADLILVLVRRVGASGSASRPLCRGPRGSWRVQIGPLGDLVGAVDGQTGACRGLGPPWAGWAMA